MRWENYFVAGYTVKGASDVEVNRYCRTFNQAETEAQAAAEVDVARLKDLGIAGEVDIWVRPWRTRRVQEVEEKQVVLVLSTERRRETVELDR